MKARVAITGLGCVTSLGHDVKTSWAHLIEGKSGISKIERDGVDLDKLPVKIGGVVNDFTLADEILSEKEQGRFDRFIHYGLKSAHEALGHANLLNDRSFYDSNRMGCIVGVGMGGFPLMEKTYETFLNRGARRVSPFFIPSMVPNLASGLISIKFKLKGVNYVVASACASASHAISASAFEIISGQHDMMVAGGAECVICNLPISGFASMKALSKQSDPHKASRPFDKDRDGFVMGDGAGILILENYELAETRGANIIAELVGFGANSDAYHITAPNPTGEGASECINKTLDYAGVSPGEVDYVNAHGTSTPLGDLAETLALKKSFGKHAANLQISSTKSMIGHLLGAAGGIETIVCVKALETGIIPPTINLDNQDAQCDLNYTANVAQKKEINYALNNSFGFGGTNSSLLIKRY